MVNPLAAIKRAPRWAYYGAAGIGAGAIGIRVWKGRDAPPDTVVAGELAQPELSTGYGGGGGVGLAASPSTGFVVPPVIIGNTGDSEPGVGKLSEIYLGGVQDLFGAWGSVLGDSRANNEFVAGVYADNQTFQGGILEGYLGAVGAAFGAGSALASDAYKEAIARAGNSPAVVAPPPVINVSYPAPAPVAPQGPSPAAAPAAPRPQCNSPFPFYQEVGTRAGLCYRVEGPSKNRPGGSRVYSNGDSIPR